MTGCRLTEAESHESDDPYSDNQLHVGPNVDMRVHGLVATGSKSRAVVFCGLATLSGRRISPTLFRRPASQGKRLHTRNHKSEMSCKNATENPLGNSNENPLEK